MSLDFSWYEIVSGADMEQGDFLDSFPIIIQPLDMPVSIDELEGYELEPDVQIRNVIVMTQSCDFNKLEDDDLVNLCPRSNYSDLYGKKKWDSLRTGRIINAHLLSNFSSDLHVFEYQVVDLSRIFSVPYGYVKKFANAQETRIRLLPPYREHLAQAFAKRFMRVGLPLDLPREYPYPSEQNK